MAYNPVKSHPIHDALKRLLVLQKNAVLTSINGEISEQHSWYLDRIFYLARRADGQIRKRISLAVSLNALNSLNVSAESIITELNNFISNRNSGHIDGAFNQAEQGFQIYLQQAFPAQGSIEGSDADTALASLKATSQAALLEVQSEKAKLLSQIQELSTSVSSNLESINALGGEIQIHQGEADQEVAAIRQSYAKLSENFEQQFSEMNENWNVTKSEKISQVDADTEKLVERITIKEIEARNLVQSVGEVLVTGSYQKTASDESNLANMFRWVTISLFSIGILIVLSNYIFHIIANFKGIAYDENPWTLVSRFLTAIVVSLPAFYTARESARHRTNADKARQRQLELSTLGPFIELLPAETKAEIRDRLTDRYFGNPVEEHTFEPPISADNLAKIAESLAKLAKPAV